MPTPEPVKVFISYSHKDERYREQLQEHLFAAKRQDLIEDWHDRRIAPGEEWEDLISENLETSDIILLLVSSSFIASPYCYDKEMQRALEKHEAGQARVIPIILRPVDWSEAPFARLQALPRNGRAVSKWSNRDEAWMDVAKGIRAAVKQLRSEGQPDTLELVDEEEEEEAFASRHREVLGSSPASPWEYVDFELNIDEGNEPRKYSISARSMESEAKAEMRFPFDEWQLKDRLRDLEVALLRSGGTRRGLGTAEEQTVQEFGRALFEALFADDIGVRYKASLREARRQGKGLRLKLRVRPPELSTLPWEFIYQPDGDYLVLSSTTPLVRYLDVPQPVEQLAVSPPFRILGMVASPQGLPPLEVEHEKRLVEEAVKELQAGELVELRWLEGQSWRDLQRAMRSGPWHIFHFVGHGGFDPATEEGAIVLSDEEGHKDLLRARALARLLDDHFPLRLVFLNSCEGAKGSERDAFSSIAATLVRWGVPAVVAMQYEISDMAAIEFSRNFYEAVADGLPVDAAATEARTAVSMKSALEWGTPVLYMRSGDGLIFDIPPKARDTKSAEATEEVVDQERLLHRYRESVESAWTSGELDRAQTERLTDLADELRLNSSAAAGIEREVMGDTIEEILDRHEQAAREEEERRNRLDGLYGRAHALHRDRKWQAVLDIFAEIHAEDSDYPDPEELLQSARNALERTRKEQDTIRRYREAVEWGWADEDLNGREVKRLRDLVDRLELSSNTAAGIEREIMGETKEAILERHEQASAEHYRTAVEEASTDNELSNQEGVWLRNLASELGLSTDTAADIEREVTGETIPAILQRQRRLDELYVQARQLHQGQEWQSVVDVFERIHSEDPQFPDPEGLLASAREALDQMRKVADLYDKALQYVDGSEWQQALECFEEVQQLEPGYRDTEELLSQVRRELATPPMVKVPYLSGRVVSQASSVLTSRGLKLGAQSEAPSDVVPEGQIIEQGLEADTKVEVGSSVSVTVSSGPSAVAVPDLVGKSRAEAESILRAADLELGKIVKVSSDDLPEGEIVEQHPATGSKVERGASVRVTAAQKRIEEPKTEKPTKRRLSSRPDFLPEEPEPRQPGRLEDHPDESTVPSVGRERSTIERYREMVEDYYKKGWDGLEVGVRSRLRQFARERGISQDHADRIKREVTGDTKDAVPGRMHQTEGAPSSGRSEEPPSQHGRKSEKPTDLPD